MNLIKSEDRCITSPPRRCRMLPKYFGTSQLKMEKWLSAYHDRYSAVICNRDDQDINLELSNARLRIYPISPVKY